MLTGDYKGEGEQVSRARWLVFTVIAAGAILSFLGLDAVALKDNFLRVYFFDVGQGDAVFIQAPSGNQVLIDGGPDDRVVQELSQVMPFHDRSIDLVILTHPHADHIDGLIEVLKRYDVAWVLENYYYFDSPDYREWNGLKNEALVTQAVAGQIVDLGFDIELHILYPLPENAGQVVGNPNNASVVLKLVYGRESLLLAGDIEGPVEKKLVALGTDLDSDFLKVAHHGSKTSTTEDFLEAVTPKAAFIEVGAKNRYGHPHPKVLERLESLNIKYYRTDIDGTIELLLDGRNYLIK